MLPIDIAALTVGGTTAAFVVLKLLLIISWPWLWVFAPLWGTFALSTVFGVFLWLLFTL